MRSSASACDRIGRRRLLLGAAALPLAGCGPRAVTDERTGDGTGERTGGALPPGAVAERRVAAGGVELNVLSAGSGPAVVLIHGASGNARDWTFGAMQAIARRRTAIAFDRPGLGRSDAPADGVESPFVQARLMAAGLRALGHRRPVLVGHSYGGAVALAWALDAPDEVAAVVLLGSVSQVFPGGVGITNDLLARPLLGPLLAPAAAALVPETVVETAVGRVFAPQVPPADYVERLGRAQILDPAALRVNARQLTALKDHLRTMVPRYPGLPMPIEILHGDADETVPLDIHSRPLAAQVRRGELVVLRGIGHMPHHADLDSLLAALGRLPTA